MDRRHDGVARPVLVAAFGPDPDASPSFEDQLRDHRVAVDRRSVVGQVADEGVDELARAAFGDRPAARLAPADDLIRQEPGSGSVDRDCGLRCHPAHEGSNVLGFELVTDHVAGAHHRAATPDPAAWVLTQQLFGGRPVPDRPESTLADQGLHLVPLLEQRGVSCGVVLREASDLGDRLLRVEPHGESFAVGECNHLDGIGVDVRQPVLLDQAQLVEPDQRIHLDERVAGGTRVDPHAVHQHLFGGGATTGNGAGVDDGALVPRRRQIGGGDERVVAGARDDDVSGLGHVVPPMIMPSRSVPASRGRTAPTGTTGC